ncbi:MAG: aminotransferase class I/II-fold pyridoxal phosphate-dependent enzyme [Rubricoccaceae bacterium]|nr:aminotransferase class I/II-fold pyridoxal phosphate-dependent enzyme [Rubricoccaceae bacterium]
MNEAPLHLIRREVRAERAYRVPTAQATAKLDQNESPFDLPADVKRRILEQWVAYEWNRYPDDRPHRLIAGLADVLNHPADGIIVGNGSNEIVHTLGLAMMGRDVPVVLPRPMFALFESVARMHGSQVVPVEASGTHFRHDAGQILNAARESKAAVTIVTTPNNPTGQAISLDALELLAREVPGFLLIDEAYHEFVDGPTSETLVARYPNVLVLRTFSKAMGLAGVRLGYLLGATEVIQEIEKARLPFMVDAGAEAIGLAILVNRKAIRDRAMELRAERERVEGRLQELEGVDVVPGAANFFLMRTSLSSAKLIDRLIGFDIRVRNMANYPALAPSESSTGYVRVSAGSQEENDRFLEAMADILQHERVSSAS